jgi:hypothetical protein
MTHSQRTVLLVVASALVAAGLCACDKSGGSPGQKLDRALDQTGEKFKEVGESIKTK